MSFSGVSQTHDSCSDNKNIALGDHRNISHDHRACWEAER